MEDINNKTFRFARPKMIEMNGHKMDMEYSWMLVLESIEDLDAYSDLYHTPQIKEGLQEIMTKKCAKHNSTIWGGLVEDIADITGEHWLVTSTRVENDVYKAKANLIIERGRIYVNSSGGCFPHSDSIEIMEEKEVKGLVWPIYSIKDIIVKKWRNGTHWYAKIGKMDVVIDGEQKWDTYKEAYSEALKFFETENL